MVKEAWASPALSQAHHVFCGPAAFFTLLYMHAPWDAYKKLGCREGFQAQECGQRRAGTDAESALDRAGWF